MSSESVRGRLRDLEAAYEPNRPDASARECMALIVSDPEAHALARRVVKVVKAVKDRCPHLTLNGTRELCEAATSEELHALREARLQLHARLDALRRERAR
jgi:hypothetical protein